jgi:hypothetical protein
MQKTRHEKFHDTITLSSYMLPIHAVAICYKTNTCVPLVAPFSNYLLKLDICRYLFQLHA